jgi:hypothetical protein
MADLEARVSQLEQDMATLAEIIGTGTAGHIRTPGGNPALDIAKSYAAASAPVVDEGPVTLCLKPRFPEKAAKGEDSEVCLQPKGHERRGVGHAFGNAPMEEEQQA